MVARYGREKLLPEWITRDIFREAPAELTSRVSPEQLRKIAFMTMVLVDSNAHLTPGMEQGGIREATIRRWAENRLRQAVQRDASGGDPPG